MAAAKVAVVAVAVSVRLGMRMAVAVGAAGRSEFEHVARVVDIGAELSVVLYMPVGELKHWSESELPDLPSAGRGCAFLRAWEGRGGTRRL